MNIFLSLFIIFTGGILGGFLFEKIRLPKLIWYIILGLLIGPSLFNIVDDTLISISSYLRQIALVIILTRSGLSLDINHLKKIGRPAILLCFIPATFEIIGVLIFAPMFLGISYIEALLLGSVLAAVSPAIDFRSTFSSNFFPLECIFKISSLPFTSGSPILIVLSNLPGLNKALSSISGLFVAASTIIPSSVSNPSISTNNWFRVWLFSVSAPLELVLLEPIASISTHELLAFKGDVKDGLYVGKPIDDINIKILAKK